MAYLVEVLARGQTQVMGAARDSAVADALFRSIVCENPRRVVRLKLGKETIREHAG